MTCLKPHLVKLINNVPLRPNPRSFPTSLLTARFVTSAHSSYVSSSKQAGMAEVVNEITYSDKPSSSSRPPLEHIDSIASRPDPLVLTPIKGGLGFEAVKSRETIGRPIYLDMQVSFTFLD